jgi:hypothetical protein
VALADAVELRHHVARQPFPQGGDAAAQLLDLLLDAGLFGLPAGEGRRTRAGW